MYFLEEGSAGEGEAADLEGWLLEIALDIKEAKSMVAVDLRCLGLVECGVEQQPRWQEMVKRRVY